MAGSYQHITDHDTGAFIGTELLDNLGDAYEALEECYGMIWYLAGGDLTKVKEAAASYMTGLEKAPRLEDDQL